MFVLEKQIRKIGEILAVIGGIAIILMMLHVVADVALKYLLNDPIDGTTEIVAAYYMVGVVFLPLAYVAFTSGHLIVELFTSRLRDYPLRLLIGFTGLATLGYLAFIVYHTVVEALGRTKEGEAWETSVDLVAVWPSRWLLPIGLGAMAIYVLFHAVQHLWGKAPSDSGVRLDI
jgi:TRAP-type C4-dicarboxylate transport system permease small subunit